MVGFFFLLWNECGLTRSVILRAMTHDKDRYPDPNAFKPERFFSKDGKLNDDDHILAFGFGRR